MEGEFGERAPKSGQKAETKRMEDGSETDAEWMQSECRMNAERIV